MNAWPALRTARPAKSIFAARAPSPFARAAARAYDGAMSSYQYLFGPVPSRRFGRSLGVDLVPHKTCSLNCVFCEVGRSTEITLRRAEYVPTRDVLAELDDWLKTDGDADYITLAGSGEPTLHTHCGEILDHLRNHTPIATAVLTNGTLLVEPAVRLSLASAGVVKTTLSAWDPASYERIHRPHPDATFERLLEGTRRFRREYTGQLWLEVVLLAGLNDRPEDVRRIAALAKEIGPDRIHLNTAVRPPAEASAEPVVAETLAGLVGLFTPAAELAVNFRRCGEPKDAVSARQILDLLDRRPCTAQQIADAFAVGVVSVAPLLDDLLKAGRVRTEQRGAEVFFAGVRGERKSFQ